jgi:RNA polymerase sigma factor (sigma-70 family)
MSRPSEFLLANLPLIEQIIASVCRRKGMSADDAEEFSAVMKLRLVEDDYAVIRAFKGRSSFATYIAAVVGHALLDYRNREWGKWRPSANAERLGEVAIQLERLLYRDGLTLDESSSALIAAHPELPRDEIEKIAAELAPRAPRRRVDLDQLPETAAAPSGNAERVETAVRISSVVCEFIDRLPVDDQLILRLRFDSEMSVAQIARSLGLDQPLLYRRLYKHYADLRTALQDAGLGASDVASLIGQDTEFLDFQLKSRGLRPSEEQRERWRPGRRKDRHDR